MCSESRNEQQVEQKYLVVSLVGLKVVIKFLPDTQVKLFFDIAPYAEPSDPLNFLQIEQ
jgi:hypothetical protein